jgi:hypothetical protein
MKSHNTNNILTKYHDKLNVTCEPKLKVKKKKHKILSFWWACSLETKVKIKTSLQSFLSFFIIPSYIPKY